jgi:hypothetical protein
LKLNNSICLLCVFFSFFTVYAENVFLPSLIVQTLTGFPSDASAGIDGVLLTRPAIRFNSSYMQIEASATYLMESDTKLELDISCLKISFRLSEFVKLHAGIYELSPGAGRIFSAVSWFSSQLSPLHVFLEASQAFKPEALIQLAFSEGPWRMEFVFCPFAPRFRYPSLEGVLYPKRDIIRSYTSSVGAEYQLNELQWDTESIPADFTVDLAVGLLLGHTQSELAISSYLFYGPDREAALFSRYMDISSLYLQYRLDFRQDYTRVMALGVSAHAVVADAARVYADAGFIFNRKYSSFTPFVNKGSWQPAVYANTLSWVLGCVLSKEIRPFGVYALLDLGAEWKNSEYLEAPLGLNPAFLHRALAAYLALSSEGFPLAIRLDGVLSLEDASFLISPEIQWKKEDFVMSLTACIPLGSGTTEIGQFAVENSFFLKAGFSYKLE